MEIRKGLHKYTPDIETGDLENTKIRLIGITVKTIKITLRWSRLNLYNPSLEDIRHMIKGAI